MSDLGGRLRRYLMVGLVVIAPLGVTAYVLIWLFQRIDVIIGRYLPPIAGVRWPGLGIVALLLLLLVVGWLSERAVGRRLLSRWNSLMSRVPLVRRLYGVSSRVVQAVLEREENLFRYCALIQYPSPGSWSLAFATARAPREMEEEIGSRAVSLFLPTVPNPASGYLLILPEERVHRLEMSVEDGFRLVFSMGAAVPSEDPAGGIVFAPEPGGAPPGGRGRAVGLEELRDGAAGPADGGGGDGDDESDGAGDREKGAEE